MPVCLSVKCLCVCEFKNITACGAAVRCDCLGTFFNVQKVNQIPH